jgi:putative tricarboxylic transport membrane protein
VAWFAGLFAGTALVGFVIALATFFVVFLRVRAGVSWLRVAVLTAGGLSVILVLGHFLVLDFPRGLLQDMVDLPWPLR